jgi:hypothetical protein
MSDPHNQLNQQGGQGGQQQGGRAVSGNPASRIKRRVAKAANKAASRAAAVNRAGSKANKIGRVAFSENQNAPVLPGDFLLMCLSSYVALVK